MVLARVLSFPLRLQPPSSISRPGESWREASFFAAYIGSLLHDSLWTAHVGCLTYSASHPSASAAARNVRQA
jgi:hypothetical protein